MEGKVTIQGHEVKEMVSSFLNRTLLMPEDVHIDSIEMKNYTSDIEVHFSNTLQEPDLPTDAE